MYEWLATQRTWLWVEPLPGYAPDLNPTEQVWGNLKANELANLCSDTIIEVADIAEDGFDRVGSDHALCFSFLRHCGLRLSRTTAAGNYANHVSLDVSTGQCDAYPDRVRSSF